MRRLGLSLKEGPKAFPQRPLVRGLTLCLTTFTLLGAPGCQRSDSFDEGMPETAGYTLELGDDATSKTGTSSEDGLGSSASALNGQEAVAESLQRTRDAVEGVNAAIRYVLDPLGALIGSNDFQVAGNARVYEYDKSGVHYRFTIARLFALRFVWKLDARAQSAADTTYVRVMTGTFARGEILRRGRGLLGFDLDNLAMLDSAFHGTGKLLVAFAHVAGHKILRMAGQDYSSDVSKWEPVSGLFAGWRGPLGGTDVRLLAYGNVESSPTAAKELVAFHGRWHPAIGGRVDAAAVKGDVPENHAILSFACYLNSDLSHEGYLRITDCDATAQSCTPIQIVGQITNCIPGLQEDEAPAADPNVAPLPPEAPEDPGMPAQPDDSMN
jgi:hypothetical protein